MVQQYRTSKEPENAEDHFQACACKAVFASSIEGLPETQLSIRKVCRVSQEAAVAPLLPWLNSQNGVPQALLIHAGGG